MADYPKKYWWIILIVVPLAISLISVIPLLVDKPSENSEGEESRTSTRHPSVPAKTSEVDSRSQSAGAGGSVENRPPEVTNSKVTTHPSIRPVAIQASGVGFAPPEIEDPARRSALARRAAEVVAMRNLAEAIRGAVIQSRSEVQSGELSEDMIRVKVDAVLKLARKIKETENSDGSVTVTMEAPVSQ